MKLTTSNICYTSLFVSLFAYLLVLATSHFNVKLLECISCIPLVKVSSCVFRNTTQGQDYIFVIFCELHSHMHGKQYAFQQTAIFITLNISSN